MANLEKIVKVTQEQYDILASGGTVGEYTGLDENYIYLIKEDKDWAYPAQFLYDESDAYWASTITNDQRKILEEHDSVYVILYGTDRYILTKTYQDNSSMSFVASSDANDFVYLDVNDTTITVKYGARLDYEKYNNLVTKNTNQTITGTKTLKNVPVIFSDSSNVEVGRIGSRNNIHLEIRATNSSGSATLRLDGGASGIIYQILGSSKWQMSANSFYPLTLTADLGGTGTATFNAVPIRHIHQSGNTYYYSGTTRNQYVVEGLASDYGIQYLATNSIVGTNARLFKIGPYCAALVGENLPSKSSGDAIYHGRDITQLMTASGLSGVTVNSAKKDNFYALYMKPEYTCTCNYSGDGSATVSESSDGLWHPWQSTSTREGISWYLGNLFNGKFSNGATFPVDNLSTNPLILTIKSSTIIDSTDTECLVLFGWRYDGKQKTTSDYYGKLTDYTLEICTDYTNDTWVKVLERTNVEDIIDCIMIPVWSSLGGSDNFKDIYGIRLTVTGAIAGSSGKFGFTSIKLLENRPAGRPSDAVNALDTFGGTMYGDVIFENSKIDSIVRPSKNTVPNEPGNSYLGTSAYRWGYVFTDNLRLGSKSYNYVRVVNDNYLEISSNNGIIRSTSSFIPNNANNDLGGPNNKWRDVYVARYLSDGTNTVTIAEIKKKYIVKKTFTGVIAQSTTNTTRYFGRMLPVDYNNLSKIHYKEKITIPGHPEWTMIVDCQVSIQGSSVRSYYSYNDCSSSYMPINYHYAFLPTTTGISAGYGIPLGEQLYQYTTESGYARTFEIEILEVENCSFEFFYSMLINTAVPGYTTTNTNFTTQTGTIWAEWLSPGLVESLDRNDVPYLSDTYSRHPAGTNGIKGLQFIMQKRDGTWESITTTNGQGTSKILNRSGFLPDRLIWYNSSADVSNGVYTATWNCYYIYNIDRRYVDNAGTLTSKQYNDYYFKGKLINGLFYFDTTQWWSFELPTTDDGFVYMLVGNLGQNNNGNQLAISKDHPMYKYDASVGGVIEVYANQSSGGTSLYRHAISFSDVHLNSYRFEIISEKSTALMTVAEVVGVMRGAILPIPGIDSSGNYDFTFNNNKLNSIVHVEQMGPYYFMVGYTYIDNANIVYDTVDLTNSASTSVNDTVTEFVTGDPLTE